MARSMEATVEMACDRMRDELVALSAAANAAARGDVTERCLRIATEAIAIGMLAQSDSDEERQRFAVRVGMAVGHYLSGTAAEALTEQIESGGSFA